MEKSLETWKKKLLQQPKGQPVSEAMLTQWEAEGNTDETPASAY
jgi:hypothetical protein